MGVKRGPSEQKWTDEYKPSNFDVLEEYSKFHIGSAEHCTFTNVYVTEGLSAVLGPHQPLSQRSGKCSSTGTQIERATLRRL